MTDEQFNEMKALLGEVSAKLDKLEQIAVNTKPSARIFQIAEWVGLAVTIGGAIFVVERFAELLKG